MLKATLKRTHHEVRTRIKGRRTSVAEIAVLTARLIEKFAEFTGEKDMDKAVDEILHVVKIIKENKCSEVKTDHAD